jgi:hypothetical protein
MTRLEGVGALRPVPRADCSRPWCRCRVYTHRRQEVAPAPVVSLAGQSTDRCLAPIPFLHGLRSAPAHSRGSRSQEP